jgi:hypothetical protein
MKDAVPPVIRVENRRAGAGDPPFGRLQPLDCNGGDSVQRAEHHSMAIQRSLRIVLCSSVTGAAARAKEKGRYLLVLPDVPLAAGFVQSLVAAGPVPVVPWLEELLFIEPFPVEPLPLEQWILDAPPVGELLGLLW